MNVFVSSGDGGSRPDEHGQLGRQAGTKQTEWQSYSPWAVGVGGTILRVKPTGEMDSESGWPGSGGGISLVFSRPAYQTGGTIPAGSKRLVPDVSLVAAPETGAYVPVKRSE